MAHTTLNADPRARVRELIETHSYGGWDKAWKEKVTPWDVGELQLPLKHLIESREVDFPRRGRALVPGCGKGYDAIYIASSLGLDTIGMDISRTAIEIANMLLEDVPSLPMGKVTFEARDFFDYHVPENQLFDLIYDYTFFVAIPPIARVNWGSQMCKLVKPGGYLITLISPIIDPPQDGGPPFAVRPEDYYGPLGPGWEKIMDKDPEFKNYGMSGQQRMVVWRKI